ncbi:MAG: phosphoribosyltransferase [Nitrososphaerota archaeon]|nr:phosphoribosyltransferase [Nitrososphaerota archaeon]
MEKKGLGFRLTAELGFPKPIAYSFKREALADMVSYAKASINDGLAADEDRIRGLWAGSFRNNSLVACAESLSVLRQVVDMRLKRYEGGDALVRLTNDCWKCMPQGFALDLEDEQSSPLLNFERKETVVVANMVGGFECVPPLIGLMQKLGREPFAYVLAGYSKHGETRFADGDLMIGEFFVPPRELETLARNKKKTALVVDDTECGGTTYAGMRKGLKKIGFEKIYKVATVDSVFLDSNGKRCFS